jgi:hypothetical protein
VEIDGGAMHVTPLGPDHIKVLDRGGKEIAMPLEIQLPAPDAAAAVAR